MASRTQSLGNTKRSSSSLIKAVLGADAGIGEVKRFLRACGHGDLTHDLSQQHVARKYFAHPKTNLLGKLEGALVEVKEGEGSANVRLRERDRSRARKREWSVTSK